MDDHGVMDDELSLHSRLRNCLLTILEFRDELSSDSFGLVFSPELGLIRNFLDKLGQIALCEEDVQRIEKAIAAFLRELGVLFEKEKPVQKSGKPGGNLRLQ